MLEARLPALSPVPAVVGVEVTVVGASRPSAAALVASFEQTAQLRRHAAPRAPDADGQAVPFDHRDASASQPSRLAVSAKMTGPASSSVRPGPSAASAAASTCTTRRAVSEVRSSGEESTAPASPTRASTRRSRGGSKSVASCSSWRSFGAASAHGRAPVPARGRGCFPQELREGEARAIHDQDSRKRSRRPRLVRHRHGQGWKQSHRVQQARRQLTRGVSRSSASSSPERACRARTRGPQGSGFAPTRESHGRGS